MDLRLRRPSGSNHARELRPQETDVVETAVTSALKSPEEGHIWEWMLHKGAGSVCVGNFLGRFKPKVSLRKSDTDT